MIDRDDLNWESELPWELQPVTAGQVEALARRMDIAASTTFGPLYGLIEADCYEKVITDDEEQKEYFLGVEMALSRKDGMYVPSCFTLAHTTIIPYDCASGYKVLERHTYIVGAQKPKLERYMEHFLSYDGSEIRLEPVVQPRTILPTGDRLRHIRGFRAKALEAEMEREAIQSDLESISKALESFGFDFDYEPNRVE